MPEPPTAPIPLTSSVFEDSATMDEFLTRVVVANDEFWSAVFTGDGRPEPYVTYVWPAPGEVREMECEDQGQPVMTTDATAAYCPADDTIYISQQYAYNLWNGLADRPGPAPEVLPADFGLAYLVGHEFAHSIQAELGLVPQGETVKNHELQADCLAGIWANWAYHQNQLEAGDVTEAIEAVEWGGDDQVSEQQHHGTPPERSAAWTLGFQSGSPGECAVYNAPS